MMSKKKYPKDQLQTIADEHGWDRCQIMLCESCTMPTLIPGNCSSARILIQEKTATATRRTLHEQNRTSALNTSLPPYCTRTDWAGNLSVFPEVRAQSKRIGAIDA